MTNMFVCVVCGEHHMESGLFAHTECPEGSIVLAEEIEVEDGLVLTYKVKEGIKEEEGRGGPDPRLSGGIVED